MPDTPDSSEDWPGTRDSRLLTRDSGLQTPDSFDLIVIGAGINGTGIARDAAMRGLRVLMLDKGDISSGTTAYSTRLIHGGLRYLEHLEVGLVRESLRERRILLDIAPHLVKPISLLIPIYRHSKRGRLMIRAGMAAYALLSTDKSLGHYQMLSVKKTLSAEPGLNPDGLMGGAEYFDGQVQYAERLALENALSARDNGAIVRTYSRVDRFVQEGRRVRGVEYADPRTGNRVRALAPMTVNVTGPWVDQLLEGTDARDDKLIGGTKGSHIIVGKFSGAPERGLYVEARSDGRPFFIIPWNNMYLIGTTDIRYSGSLDALTADASEIDYLIREANTVIPGARLNRQAVLYSYAGVRPLPYTAGGQESAITRRHIIRDHSTDERHPLHGLLSVIGGKLTTYRALSERVVDVVFNKLGRISPGCRTAEVRLPGAPGTDVAELTNELKSDPGLSDATARHLVSVYGARAKDVLRIASEEPGLGRLIDPMTGALAAEVTFSFKEDLARTLADCLLRRTMIGTGADLGRASIEPVLAVCKAHLGWSEDRAARERADYMEYIGRFIPSSLSK